MTDQEFHELFVRKDVYDVNSARLEALMEKTIAQNEAAIAGLRGEVQTMNAKIDSMNSRIDDLQAHISRSFTVMGLIFGSIGFLIALPSVLNALMPYLEKFMTH